MNRMTKIDVSISGGRMVSVMRGKLSPDTEKKKSTKPPNHDIAMACVCFSWMAVNELASELMKREAVEHVSITGPGLAYELSK